MEDQYYDALLHIKTGGLQKEFPRFVYYNPYEPTPYHALETLFQQYPFHPEGRVVDFGCGKGRLLFYLHHFLQASVVGVEMNEALFREAAENKSRYLKMNKKLHRNRADGIELHCCLAEEYEINPLDHCFYFFNPFTIPIFIKIVNNIIRSLEKAERQAELVLYYPPRDYIDFLENHTFFVLKQEVVLPGLYEHNPNERFVIYGLG